MTDQPPGVHDLDAVLEASQWRPGSHQSGVDDRVEFAHLSGVGADGGRQVAVRDPRHRDGPALVFSHADWEALCSSAGGDTVVDLRDKVSPRQAQELP
jgi:Domain of unknown function (DUF397)